MNAPIPSSRLSRFLIVVFLFVGTIVLDIMVGYQVRLGALYCVAVGVAAWLLGPVAGVVSSLAATGTSVGAEVVAGAVFSASWVPYVNAASRLVVFLFVAFSISYFHRTVREAQNTVRAFGERLPICCHCHRVETGDDLWMDFPTYLRTHGKVQPEFKVCRLCSGRDQVSDGFRNGKAGPS